MLLQGNMGDDDQSQLVTLMFSGLVPRLCLSTRTMQQQQQSSLKPWGFSIISISIHIPLMWPHIREQTLEMTSLAAC